MSLRLKTWQCVLLYLLAVFCGLAVIVAAGMRIASSYDPAARWVRQLHDPEPYYRQLAAEELGHQGPHASHALPALIEAMGDENPEVRVEAAVAVLRIDPWNQRPIPVITNVLLNSREPMSRSSAALALSRLGPGAVPAVPALIQALKDTDDHVRECAAQALGHVGPAAHQAIPALGQATNEVGTDVPVYAAQALGEIGAKEAVPALIAALRHENPQVRVLAAQSLGEIGPEARDAVPALVFALGDGEAEVKAYAAQSLRRIDPQRSAGATGP
jgi:HEAT repeat protein